MQGSPPVARFIPAKNGLFRRIWLKPKMGAAYDSAAGLRDEEVATRRGDRARDRRGRDEGEEGGTGEFLRKLACELSAEEWAALGRRLRDEDADRAEDEPPPFKGRPRPSGAMDARRRLASDASPSSSFAERFPEAARIKAAPSFAVKAAL